MLPKNRDIINFFENEFSDIRKQSEWDFSGMQVYSGDKPVTKIALSLDPTEEVIESAINEGCELLITHHPLFFRPSKGLDFSKSVDRRAIKAIKGGLDILSYHTNFDMASGGTSDYLCSLLGFKTEKGFISKEGAIPLYSLSVYVPESHKDSVFNALTKAGGGAIGDYKDCGYFINGQGTFLPKENASPFIGKAGQKEVVQETKIEITVEEKYLGKAINAMIEAHPYETPAFNVVKLENGLDYGFGKVCDLGKEYTLSSFIDLLKSKLENTCVRTNMEDIKPFCKIGVCTGSGASMWKDCKKLGLSVLLTGDMKYHDALDATEGGVCVIDAGHQATEEIYMRRVSEILQENFNVKTIVYNTKKQMISWG